MTKAASQPKPPLWIEWMALNELERRLDPDNPKDHDVGALLESFSQFGYVNPIAINEETGLVIYGHGRIHAARAGFDDGQDPPERVWDDGQMWHLMVVRGIHLPAAKGKAYLIADNRQMELGGWDEPKRLALLEQLAKSRRLKGTGYDADDVDRMRKFYERSRATFSTKRPALAKEQLNRVFEKWGTAEGQLWKMPSASYSGGEHRLLVGDSMLAKSWMRLMDGRKAQMVFTDPPYGVKYLDKIHQVGPMKGDELVRTKFIQFLTKVLKHLVTFTVDDAPFYIWYASRTWQEFHAAMTAAGLVDLEQIIWVKDYWSHGWSDYQWAHEPCFYAAKDGHRPKFLGELWQTTVWQLERLLEEADNAVDIGPGVVLSDGAGSELYISTRVPTRRLRHILLEDGNAIGLSDTSLVNGTVWRASRNIGGTVTEGREGWHPTQKPVPLAEKALMNSSALGDVVLDGFLGSGTTMVAAEQQGRLCYGIELEAKYAAVILERMSALGLKPERTS